MKIGTKSLLFGCHQFLIHPLFTMAAYRKLYGPMKDYRIAVACFVHDWGYWGQPNIDGMEGKWHPIAGASLCDKWFDCGSLEYPWFHFCIGHSAFTSTRLVIQKSRLYYADKLAFCLEPWWLYLPRVILSGEIKEFREQFPQKDLTNRQWFEQLKVWTMEKVSYYNEAEDYLGEK